MFGVDRAGPSAKRRRQRSWVFFLSSALVLAGSDAPSPSVAQAAPPQAAAKAKAPTNAKAATVAKLPTLAELKTQVVAQRKAAVLLFGARWCGPCHVLDQKVLPQPEVQKALGKVVFVHYDAEETPGQEAARALRIVGYPTLVALAQDGSEIDRIEGYQGPEDLVRWLEQVSTQSETDATLKARLDKDPGDAEALVALGRRQLKRKQEGEGLESLKRARTAAAAKPELQATADWELRNAELRRLLREEPRKALAAHLQAHPTGPHAETAFKFLVKLGPIDATSEPALVRYIDTLTAGKPSASTQLVLNRAVYGCLRTRAYDLAERAARKLVAVDEYNPLYLDTLAEVFHLRSARAQALSYSDKALLAVEKQKNLADRAEIKAALVKNRARFERALGEAPAELLEEEEELMPWEQPAR